MTLLEIINSDLIGKPVLVQKGSIILLVQSLVGANNVLALNMSTLPTEGYSSTGWVVYPATSTGWTVL